MQQKDQSVVVALMRFFGLTMVEFKREWTRLSTADKDELKALMAAKMSGE